MLVDTYFEEVHVVVESKGRVQVSRHPWPASVDGDRVSRVHCQTVLVHAVVLVSLQKWGEGTNVYIVTRALGCNNDSWSLFEEQR